jgi:hypothetical protein
MSQSQTEARTRRAGLQCRSLEFLGKVGAAATFTSFSQRFSRHQRALVGGLRTEDASAGDIWKGWMGWMGIRLHVGASYVCLARSHPVGVGVSVLA